MRFLLLSLLLLACDRQAVQPIQVKVEVWVQVDQPKVSQQVLEQPKVEQPSTIKELFSEYVLLNEDTKKAYYTISSLLKEDNVDIEDEATQCHLLKVASEVGEQSKYYDFNPVRLITIGFNESRFGVNEYLNNSFPISASGDCGIYQQQPQFAVLEHSRKCDDFKSVSLATEQAILFVKNNIIKRYKAKNTDTLDKMICHYNSGNICNNTKKYVKEHKETRLKADKLYKSMPKGFKLPKPTCAGFTYAQGS